MKRITKIRIKYFLILVCLAVFSTMITPTLMRYYISVKADAVGYAKATRTSTYKIVFHSNGGTGTMEDMIVNYTEPKKLSANLFTHEKYTFDHWNTQSDDKGTTYTDEQEINMENYIVDNEINLYAQWSQGVAEINGEIYQTLQDAINAVPTNNIETVIKLLKNASENVEIVSKKNIILDLQNNTLTNSINEAVIKNYGTVKISNGTITTTAATNGAVNNYKSGKLRITDVTIISTGGRQALYNDGGSVEILENAYLSSTTTERPAITNNTSSSTMNIISGTIISTGQSGIENKGKLTIGTVDGEYNENIIVIKGEKYGINSINNSTFNFFDGTIKGKIFPINNKGTVLQKEDEFDIVYHELENDANYITAKLEKRGIIETVSVTFVSNYENIPDETRTVIKGDVVGDLPELIKPEYIFDGWFTELESGEQITNNYIVTNDITFYAHWSPKNEVRCNGVNYTTFEEALNTVPDNVQTTIILLKDIKRSFILNENKNIILDLNGKKMENNGDKNAVIKNYGTIEIINGEITSKATNGAIDNESTGRMKINNLKITIYSGRQTLYNNGGYMEIHGNSYFEASASGKQANTKLSRGTIQNINNGEMHIFGGTIVALSQQAIANESTLTIGSKDGNVVNTPTIISSDIGISTISTFNYYDGIIKAINTVVSGSITSIEENMQQVEGAETIDGKQYNTLQLENSQNTEENDQSQEDSNSGG